MTLSKNTYHSRLQCTYIKMVFATIQQNKSYNLIANKQNRDSLNLSQILNHCLELTTLLAVLTYLLTLLTLLTTYRQSHSMIINFTFDSFQTHSILSIMKIVTPHHLSASYTFYSINSSHCLLFVRESTTTSVFSHL